MNANNEPRHAGLREQRIDIDHHNAVTQREKYCDWCAHAVPAKDFSTKFAQAGGVLAGPFCSNRCYWDFIRTHDFHGLSRRERREFYQGETA